MSNQFRIVWLAEPIGTELAAVGGKNASLGIMLRELGAEGIKVPDGFALTSAAYWEFIDEARLRPFIAAQIRRLRHSADLVAVGAAIRTAVFEAELPRALVADITTAQDGGFARQQVLASTN